MKRCHYLRQQAQDSFFLRDYLIITVKDIVVAGIGQHTAYKIPG
jgi:hypothetical protein